MKRLVPALALAIAPTGCAPSTPAAEVDALEVLVPQEAAVLDPRFSTRALDVRVTRLVHAGLARLDPDTLEPIPGVASSWTAVDALTLDVQLQSAHFHSGAALEAEDVCATLDALRDPTLASPHRAVARSIASCVPTGARALRITWSAPRATRITDLEVPILRRDQARLPARPLGDLDGLGPYRIEEVTQTAIRLAPAATLGPAPRHWLVVRSVKDENARALRLLAGKSDVAPSAISPTLLPALEGRGGLSVAARSGANVTYLAFQNDRAPFDRVAVRRAVASAIDRTLIAETLLAGRARVAETILPPGQWATPKDVRAPAFDREQARSGLAGLGPFTLLCGTDRLRVVIARAIADQLARVGVEVRVVPIDQGVYFARLDRGDFELALLQMPEITEPNLLAWFFHPRGVPGEGGEGRNRVRYRDPEVAQLLDHAATLEDRATRRRDYALVSSIMSRDVPVVPLWHEDQVAVVSARAGGFLPSAEGRWLSLALLE